MTKTKTKTARDVLADRLETWSGYAGVYDMADRLIRDLFDAGWDIVEAAENSKCEQAFLDRLRREEAAIDGAVVYVRACRALDAASAGGDGAGFDAVARTIPGIFEGLKQAVADLEAHGEADLDGETS
jgi:hypothetical protein